jgi:hypothetical protein
MVLGEQFRAAADAVSVKRLNVDVDCVLAELESVRHFLRLLDRPPFAHEPGYAVYMLWAASHLTRRSAE